MVEEGPANQEHVKGCRQIWSSLPAYPAGWPAGVSADFKHRHKLNTLTATLIRITRLAVMHHTK